jgi:hypothetical protein
LLSRLEFDPSRLETWLAEELDVESYEPAEGGAGGYISQAIDDGSIDELPGTVAELLDYLDAQEDGWLVARSATSVDVQVDGSKAGEDPMLDAVRGAVAMQLFAHAIETAGATGYLYLLDFNLEEELPSALSSHGRDGVVHEDDLNDADPQDRMDFVERIRERARTAPGLWSVDDDEEG